MPADTADTMVYKKTGALFALNFAKNETDGTIILCEGYMDAISLHQAGFKNAIASCGTALTLEQARIISRYASEVVLGQDADGPGRKAVEKSIDIFSKVGIKVRVLNFSGAKDPDEFIKKFGADRFKGLLEGAANDIDIVVVSFDFVRISGNIRISAFDKVRAERALRKEGRIEIDIQAFSRLSGDLYKHRTDYLALRFRVAGICKRTDDISVSVIYRIIEKCLCGINSLHIDKAERAEIFTNDIALVFAHHAVVYMYSVYIFGW